MWYLLLAGVSSLKATEQIQRKQNNTLKNKLWMTPV